MQNKISIVSNITNAAGLVTVVLTDGHVKVQCADMLFFDKADIAATFYDWTALAKEQDTGCVIM